MKSTLLAATLLLAMGGVNVQTASPDSGLPELHKIKTVTLSPNYGCRSKEEFKKGYVSTALFLSGQGKDTNSPDLLFNGPCGGPDYFQGSTAGDDLTVIADLGKVALEDLRADHVFNVKRINSPELYSRFVEQLQVEAGHTYAVLINKPTVRGFFYFTVVSHVPNQRVDLRYAVQDYQLMTVRQRSPGFAWDHKSE